MPAKQSSDHKKSETTAKDIPGQGLSTAGFAVAIASIFTNFFTLGLMAVAGLILSIMGRIQTSKAGQPSGLALAGMIISGVVAFFTFASFAFFIVLAIFAADHRTPVCDGRYDEYVQCGEQYDENEMIPRHRYNASEMQPDA